MADNSNGNPQSQFALYFGAIVLVVLMYARVVKAYFVGGPEAPSVMLLIISGVVLGAGCVVVGVRAWRIYKVMLQQRKEEKALEEQMRLQEQEETE